MYDACATVYASHRSGRFSFETFCKSSSLVFVAVPISILCCLFICTTVVLGDESLKDQSLLPSATVANATRMFSWRIERRVGTPDYRVLSVGLGLSYCTPRGISDVAVLKELRDMPPPAILKLQGLPQSLGKVHEALEVLSKTPNLEELVLEVVPCDETCLERFLQFPTLRRLTIQPRQDEEASDTSEDWMWKHLSLAGKLEYLSMSGCNINGRGVKCLAGLRQLHTLDVSSTGVDDDALAEIASIESLRSIDLSDTGVSPAGLMELQKVPFLTSIQLSELSEDVAASLKKCAKLQCLALTSCRNQVHGLAQLSSLQTLQMQASNQAIVQASQLPLLEDLILWNIRDDDLKALSACKALRRLTLIRSNITREGLMQVIANKNIEELSLQQEGRDATNHDVPKPELILSIEDLKQMPHLRRLSLQFVVLSEDSLKRFDELNELEEVAFLWLAHPSGSIGSLSVPPKLRKMAIWDTPKELSWLQRFRDLKEIEFNYLREADGTERTFHDLEGMLPKGLVVRYGCDGPPPK